MSNKELVSLLNNQINMEWYSAYIYLDIYGYYMNNNLKGFGNWFYVQTQEERDHAMLFIKYLLNNNERPRLQAIKAPDFLFEGLRDPIKVSYDHERKVTESINNIYAVACSQKDYPAMQLLEWFVKEQVEEEQNTGGILKRYDLLGNDAKGINLLDGELDTRVYAPSSLVL